MLLKYKKNIAIGIWIIINSLFVFKYSYRLSPCIAIVTTLIYNGVLYCCLGFCYKRMTLFSDKVWYLFLLGVTAFSALIFQIIPVETIKVDRWEMIQIFWDAVHAGVYPYAVHSPAGNYPGPMPVYFLIAYPFYLLQEIGWLGVIAVWLTFLFIKKQHLEQKQQTFMFLFIMLSVTIYYEIVTRSTILLNSMVFIFYYVGLKNLHKYSTLKFYGYALLGGIIFSTRNVFAIPMVLWGVSVLLSQRIKFMKLLKWCICFCSSFFATFIPFLISYSSQFWQYNPFITQGSALLPFSYILLFVMLAFLLPLLCKKEVDVFFLSVILFFAVVTTHVIYSICNVGINAFLFSGADISYYIFCIPFILELLTRKEND